MFKRILLIGAIIIASVLVSSCGSNGGGNSGSFKDNGKLEGTYKCPLSSGDVAYFVIGPKQLEHSYYDSEGYLVKGSGHMIDRSLVTESGSTWQFSLSGYNGKYYDYYLDVSTPGKLIYYQLNGWKEVYTKISNSPNFD